MRKIILIGLGIVALTAAALFISVRLFPEPIGLALMERLAGQRMGTDLMADLPDGLTVGLCGTGSPLPDPTRAGPCTFVVAGDRLFIVDTGSGSTRNLLQMGVPLGQTEALLLTHFHSDHIADLGELRLQRWVGGANSVPLPVYGPVGVGDVIAGFNAAYDLDDGYRTAHHGAAIAPPAGANTNAVEIAIGDAPNADAVVIDDGDLRVTMFRVDHSPVEPAIGYRFDYKGRSVVISGDTAFAPSVAEHAAGADLLVHEALQPRMVEIMANEAEALGRQNIAQIAHDILDYHTSPEDAARTADAADVDALVLNHIVPPLPNRILYGAFLGDAASLYSGPITVGKDRMVFVLPADQPGVIDELRR